MVARESEDPTRVVVHNAPGKSLQRDPCTVQERGGTGTKGHKRPGSRGSGLAGTNAAGWHTQCPLWSQLTCYAKESCLITTT